MLVATYAVCVLFLNKGFISNEFPINFFFQSGLNCLHLASKEGHVDVVTELIKRDIPINQPTKVSIRM